MHAGSLDRGKLVSKSWPTIRPPRRPGLILPLYHDLNGNLHRGSLPHIEEMLEVSHNEMDLWLGPAVMLDHSAVPRSQRESPGVL